MGDDQQPTPTKPLLPRRLAPIGDAAPTSTSQPEREPQIEEPEPEPEPEPSLEPHPPVHGVDDDGNASPPWGWDWCAIFPEDRPNDLHGARGAVRTLSQMLPGVMKKQISGSREMSERRKFVRCLRRAELTVKTIQRFGGSGRTFVLIGCGEGRLKEEAERIKLRVRQSARYGSDRLMPYAEFRSSEPPDRYERFLHAKSSPPTPEFCDAPKCFFSSYHRKLLIESIISTSGHLTNGRTAGLNIDHLMHQGQLSEFFPLHDPPKLERLKDLNDSHCTRCRCFRSSGRQPLDLLRQYLGDQWALYFAWLELYTNLLVIPAIVGCGVYTYTMIRADQGAHRQGVIDSIWSLGFSFFLCGWGCLWRDLWKRKNAALAYRWGTKGVQRAESVRSDFLGHSDGHLSLDVPPESSGSCDGQICITPTKPISFGLHSTVVFSAQWEPHGTSTPDNMFVRLEVTLQVSNHKGSSDYQHEGRGLDNLVHKEGDLVKVSTKAQGVPDDEQLFCVASEIAENRDGVQQHFFHLKPVSSKARDGETLTAMRRVRGTLSSVSMLRKLGKNLIPTLARECTLGPHWTTFRIVDRSIAEGQSIKLKSIKMNVTGAGSEGGTLRFASLSVRQARTFKLDERLGLRQLQKVRKYVRLLHRRHGSKGKWTVPAGWSEPAWKAADTRCWWIATGGFVLGVCCGGLFAYFLVVKFEVLLVAAIFAGIFVLLLVFLLVLYARIVWTFERNPEASDGQGLPDGRYRARRFGIYSGPTFIELEEFHEFYSDAYAAFSGQRAAVFEKHHQPPFYPRDLGSRLGCTHFITRTVPKQGIIVVFVLLVAIGTLLLLIVKDYLRNQYPESFTALYGGSALTAIFILMMDSVWKVVARRLTDLENHRTDSEYTDAMIRTTFAFQFVSNYLSLFYIAFIKGSLTTFGNYLPFEPAPCDCSDELAEDPVLCCRAELYAQLVSLVVLRQAYGNVKEVLLPWVTHKCNQCKLARQNESQARAQESKSIKSNQIAPADDAGSSIIGNRLKRRFKMEQETAIQGPVKQSTMKRHDSSMATFDEYNEMAIQFGYIVLFGMIFPLAPAMSLINNIIEEWSDTWKVLNTMQRPRPQLVERIGAWESIINFLCYVGILTNVFLVAFSTYQLENTFETAQNGSSWTLAEKLLACCVMEHLLLIWKWSIEAAIPDDPEWVTKAQARDEWIATEEQRFLSARGVDPLEKGDYVQILKRGTKFGRLATVTDPDWAGRVKVQLVEDDACLVSTNQNTEQRQDDGVRSYYRDELELVQDDDSNDVDGHDSAYEEDANESEVEEEEHSKGLFVVHPIGLCTDGFAACDSIGRFCGGHFVGTDFKAVETDGVGDVGANNLLLHIDGTVQTVALDGHDMSGIVEAAKVLDSALVGATVTPSCAGSFESLVISSTNYKHTDTATVKIDCKSSSKAALALLGIVPAKFVGGTFISHDFRVVDEENGTAQQQLEQLVVRIDGGQPQTVELHEDCTDVDNAARVLNAGLQPGATVSHRRCNITITSNALEQDGIQGLVEIDRLASSTDAKRLLGLLDSCSHCGSHSAHHSVFSGHEEGGSRQGDTEGEGARYTGGATAEPHPSGGHCAHCGSHPHHHRPKHQFHGRHRFG